MTEKRLSPKYKPEDIERGLFALAPLAISKARGQLEDGSVKDASTARRNLAVQKGIGLDHSLKMRGEPTVVHEHRQAEDIVKSLKRLAPKVHPRVGLTSSAVGVALAAPSAIQSGERRAVDVWGSIHSRRSMSGRATSTEPNGQDQPIHASRAGLCAKPWALLKAVRRTRPERQGVRMSESLADVVRAQFEAFERGGYEAVAEYWHPDIEWRAVEGAADDVGPFRGREAMRRYYEDWAETIDGLHTEVEEVIFEADERLVVALRVSGRGRGSGAPSHGRYWVAYTIRQGQIVSGREYGSAEQAVEASRSTESNALPEQVHSEHLPPDSGDPRLGPITES